MGGLYLLLPTLLVIVLSYLVVRGAAIALMMTGMEEQRARFQSLSAFTGTGFTTREAEIVVNNPMRRRIVTWLMILGNAGIVTVIVSATSSLITSEGFYLPIGIGILIVALLLFYWLARRGGIARRWERFIENRLLRSSAFAGSTTENLFLIKETHGLVRYIVTADSQFVGRPLPEQTLQEGGSLIMGIERGKELMHLPSGSEVLEVGDRVILYGPIESVHRLLRK
jgi:hypothetical protein